MKEAKKRSKKAAGERYQLFGAYVQWDTWDKEWLFSLGLPDKRPTAEQSVAIAEMMINNWESIQNAAAEKIEDREAQPSVGAEGNDEPAQQDLEQYLAGNPGDTEGEGGVSH